MGTEAAVDWALECLRNHGFAGAEASHLKQGTQATLILLEVTNSSSVGGAEKFILKKFSPRWTVKFPRALGEEFESLRLFHDGLSSGPASVLCPRPIDISQEHSAYLMTFLPGQSLHHHFPEAIGVSELASIILSGLQNYYRQVRKGYGDFQPDNVIVSARLVGLVDPAIPNPSNRIYHELSESSRFGPIAVDLAYWTYSVTCHSPKLTLLRPGVSLRQIRLTRELIRRSAALFSRHGANEFTEEITRGVTLHFEALKARRSLKPRLVATLGQLVAKIILWQGWRLAHSRGT